MKKYIAVVAISALALVMCLNAQAGFVNGGFEDGTFNGWTVQQGFNNGYRAYNFLEAYGVTGVPNNDPDPLKCVGWGYENFWSPAPTPIVVDKSGYTDPFLPTVQNIFLGNKAAKLNDLNNGFHVTQIAQEGTITSADYNGGSSATLYVNWAGVMENPGHDHEEDPWFIIDVYKNGSLFAEERHYSEEAGWQSSGASGPNGSQVFYDLGQFTVSGLLDQDKVLVTLTVADCAQGGHGAYAYLDGIGTTFVKPPDGNVPETATTAFLLVGALFGMGVIRRRMS